MSNQDRIIKIKALLEDALSPSYLEIIDDSHLHVGHAGARGGAGHFTVKISAPIFEGISMVKQHRLVYQAVNEMMEKDIHALSIQVMTQ